MLVVLAFGADTVDTVKDRSVWIVHGYGSDRISESKSKTQVIRCLQDKRIKISM
jgi:hypothetical protein